MQGWALNDWLQGLMTSVTGTLVWGVDQSGSYFGGRPVLAEVAHHVEQGWLPGAEATLKRH